MAEAVPDDVHGVIDTELTDAQIQSQIDDAAWEAADAITGYADWDADDKKQLEKYLAALRIREVRERSVKRASRESASLEYEGMSTSGLRRQVNRRDPSGTLAYNRDRSRHVSSTS